MQPPAPSFYNLLRSKADSACISLRKLIPIRKFWTWYLVLGKRASSITKLKSRITSQFKFANRTYLKSAVTSLVYSRIHLAIVFTAVHGYSFVLWDAFYWDDWILTHASSKAIFTMFDMAGAPWVAYIHLFLRAGGPQFYHLTTFFTNLSIAIFLYNILIRHKLTRREAFWIACFFMMLPYNAARVAEINVIADLSVLLFFAGWDRLARYATGGSIFSALISAGLFSLSFGYAALLLFYLVPLCSFLVLRKNSLTSHTFAVFASFSMLPIVFFIIRGVLFQPFGTYTGYNAIDIQVSNIASGLTSIGWEIINWQLPQSTIVLLMLLAIFIIKPFRGEGAQRSEAVKSQIVFWVGLFCSALAMFPYLAVNKVPLFSDWGSRLQILLPLGSALILWSVVARLEAILGRFSARCFSILFLVLSSIAWINVYADFHIDWLKQVAIVRAFERNNELRSEKAILIIDEANKLNALGREYRNPEFAGMALKAFGEQTRFISRYKEFSIYESYFKRSSKLSFSDIWIQYEASNKPYFIEGNLMRDASIGNIPTLIIISPASYDYNKILLSLHFSYLRLREFLRGRGPVNYFAEVDQIILMRGPIEMKGYGG